MGFHRVSGRFREVFQQISRFQRISLNCRGFQSENCSEFHGVLETLLRSSKASQGSRNVLGSFQGGFWRSSGIFSGFYGFFEEFKEGSGKFQKRFSSSFR